MNLSLNDIHINANINKETSQYIHYYFPMVKGQYDSNFIQFKMMPTVKYFEKVAHYLKAFHQTNRQEHLKFTFPANTKILDELHTYLLSSNYEIGCLEMYAIKPSQFNGKYVSNNIKVEFVNDETINEYVEIHYEEALAWGKQYADDKRSMLFNDYYTKRTKQVVAISNNKLIGSVDLIENDKTIEIDSLYVIESYRKQGVATKIQQFIMDNYANKYVILVADKEDTPREMYKKQGYHFIENYYFALNSEGAI